MDAEDEVFKGKKEKKIRFCMKVEDLGFWSSTSIRAPTANMGYVPNAKYLAYIPHQTPFDPIYQMCHISYFLQHATVES